MARGPKRKPNAIAIADGTLRKDRHGDELAIAQPCIVPSWLTDPMAIACFTRLQELLGPLGLLKATDVDIVARYCRAHADFRQAIAEMNLQGRTVATGQGGLKNHPAWARQKESAAEMQRTGAELGLSPSARAALGDLDLGSKQIDEFSEWENEA